MPNLESTVEDMVKAEKPEEEIKAVEENAIHYQENWKKYSKSLK